MTNDRIIGVELTMGSLRQLTEGGNILRCGDGERFKKFSATIETISCWSDYGQYNEDRIHLLQDGKEIPVKIGQWEFWPLIKDIHYWQKKSEASNFHKVTLNGRDAKMQLFEVTFVIDGEELLPGIIYAMIIFSRVNDIKLGKEYWDSLTGKRGLKYSSHGEHLDKVINLQNVCKQIVEGHPYIELFLQNGLQGTVEHLRESFSQLEILK